MLSLKNYFSFKFVTAAVSAILLFSLSENLGQTRTNLEMIYSLIDKSVNNLSPLITEKEELFLDFVSPEEYRTLKSSVISFLQDAGKSISENEAEDQAKLNYTINSASVSYDDMFRDGFLGSYLVLRKIDYSGSYYVTERFKTGKVEFFNYSIIDTVQYNKINNLENIAYSFSSAELPPEPLFSSLLEPAIAIGTAAAAIYLFFSIRSK